MGPRVMVQRSPRSASPSKPNQPTNQSHPGCCRPWCQSRTCVRKKRDDSLFIDQDVIDTEVNQLAMLYSVGDRAELARDLRRLRASDSPQDKAIVAGWDKFLSETKADIAAADQAKVSAAAQATEQVAREKAEASRLATVRAEAFASDPLLDLLQGIVMALRSTVTRTEFVDTLQAKLDALIEARQK